MALPDVSCFQVILSKCYFVAGEVAVALFDSPFNLASPPLFLQLPHQREALSTILSLDYVPPMTSAEEAVEASATILYGLLHARYILTPHGASSTNNRQAWPPVTLLPVCALLPGLEAMRRKYSACHFGNCPRTLCQGRALLPTGESDVLGHGTVKGFCPRCCELYDLPSSGLDGAAWGTTFALLFVQCQEGPSPLPRSVEKKFDPRIFGFRLHEKGMGGCGSRGMKR